MSSQSLSVLQALMNRVGEWRYGYDLSKELGLQSGTLYPLLMRLTDRGLLEAEWQPPARSGMPARHAYRLTPSGIAAAQVAITAQTGWSDAPPVPA